MKFNSFEDVKNYDLFSFFLFLVDFQETKKRDENSKT